jgi:hypothetical protein
VLAQPRHLIQLVDVRGIAAPAKHLGTILLALEFMPRGWGILGGSAHQGGQYADEFAAIGIHVLQKILLNL